MKRILIFIGLSFLTLSCETEHLAINNVPEDNLITNTALKSKLLQVVQSATAIDNVIDGSGCFALQFPYTVIANGQQVNLASEADYEQVYGILNANDNNVDAVIIQFPVSVKYADYSEATMTTQAQFNEAVANCIQSTELSCMDLTYPVGIKTYDSAYQLAASFDISSKQGLYEFLSNLEAYDAVVLNYPIVFNGPDGAAITVNSNQLLEQQIDTYTQQCLDALNPPATAFQEAIVQGTWYVSDFFSGTDQTADYQDYDFTFSGDGNILVTATIPSPGIWAVSQTGTVTQVGFMFMDPQLDSIGQIWNLTGFTSNTITLHIDSTGTEPEKDLTLSKN